MKLDANIKYQKYTLPFVFAYFGCRSYWIDSSHERYDQLEKFTLQDLLKREVSRNRTGIPFIYVLLVGIIGIILGYFLKRTWPQKLWRDENVESSCEWSSETLVYCNISCHCLKGEKFKFVWVVGSFISKMIDAGQDDDICILGPWYFIWCANSSNIVLLASLILVYPFSRVKLTGFTILRLQNAQEMWLVSK